MSLTKEQIQDIARAAVQEAKAAEPLTPDRKFVPGLLPDAEQPLDPKGGFKGFGEFAQQVYRSGEHGNQMPRQLTEWVGKTAGLMEEGDASQGGYLVPTEFRAQLMMTALENVIVRPRALEIPMQVSSIDIPALVDSDHSTDLFNGVICYWTGETAQMTQKNPTFGRVNLKLRDLTGYCKVTNDLLEDSPISIEPLLRTLFGMAIGWYEDDALLMGDGSAKPLGAFNAANPSLIAVTKETNQVATTILYENLVKMWARIHPFSANRAVWVANPDCKPQLMTMGLSIGTAGFPVWMPAGGAAGAPYETLMGRPLLYSEKMQTLGAQGDIGLADFSQYLIGQKGGLQMASSMHIAFDYNQMAFRFVLRVDGQPWWRTTLTPKNSSSTLSPFVVIAIRE